MKMETKPLQEVKYYGTEGTDDELQSKNVRKADTAFLFFIVVTGSMICVFNGLSFAWLSSAIPRMKSNNTEENPVGQPITTFEMSMLAGLPTLAMLFGSIVLGYLSEMIGRKGSIQIAGIGMCISIAALAFSTNVICIITFRCFWFFFSNGGLIVLLVYITEICEDHNRAKYGCLAGVFLPLGQVIGFGLGAILNYRNFTLAELCPLILFALFMYFGPESPVYSFSREKTEECTRALKRLRRNKSEKELEADLRKIKDTINASRMQTNRSVSFANLFNTKERRYALMLAFFPLMIKVFCGLGIIIPFLEPIFIAAGTKYNSRHMPIIVAVFKILGYFITSFVVEKCGRRILLLISSVGSGASLLALGYFFYLKNINSPLIDRLQWFPLACTICYIILFACGVGSIPQATMGELFTPDMRATGVSLITAIFSFFLFCSSATYPYLVEYLGLQWCLWIYGFLSVLGAIYIYVMVPENKGKTITEIQEYIKLRCNKK